MPMLLDPKLDHEQYAAGIVRIWDKHRAGRQYREAFEKWWAERRAKVETRVSTPRHDERG
jgi:hypothetical protein